MLCIDCAECLSHVATELTDITLMLSRPSAELILGLIELDLMLVPELCDRALMLVGDGLRVAAWLIHVM